MSGWPFSSNCRSGPCSISPGVCIAGGAVIFWGWFRSALFGVFTKNYSFWKHIVTLSTNTDQYTWSTGRLNSRNARSMVLFSLSAVSWLSPTGLSSVIISQNVAPPSGFLITSVVFVLLTLSCCSRCCSSSCCCRCSNCCCLCCSSCCSRCCCSRIFLFW